MARPRSRNARDTGRAMSENLELVRSIYADWQRGDFFNSTEWAHREIEFVIADGPNPGTTTGRARMIEGWRQVLGAWDGLRPQVDEYREINHERVLVLFHYAGRGKTSGLELEQMRTHG